MLNQLVKKELALQKSNFYFAALIAALWLLVYLWSFYAEAMHFFKGRSNEYVQVVQWMLLLPITLIFLPLMIGASTAASERQLDTLGWQLSMPVSRRRQWVVKCAVALLMTLWLSCILGWLLDLIMNFRLGVAGSSQLRGMWPGSYSMLVTAVAIFASTISNKPFRALVICAPLLLVVYFSQLPIDPGQMLGSAGFSRFGAFPRPLVIHLHTLALSVVLCWLAYGNFRFEGWRWRRLLGQLVLWLLIVNIIGWAALKLEYNIRRPLVSKETVSTPGLQKLLGAERISVGYWVRQSNGRFYPSTSVFDTELVRIPQSSRLAANIIDTGFVSPICRTVELDVESGKIRQIPNLAGRVSPFPPEKGVYAVQNYFISPQLVVYRSGLVLPDFDVFLNRYRSMVLTSSNAVLTSGGKPIKNIGRQSLHLQNREHRIYLIYYSDGINPDVDELSLQRHNYLVQATSNNPDETINYEVIDEISYPANSRTVHGSIGGVSHDGEWYIKSLPSKELQIIKCDHSSTHTLAAFSNGGGLLTSGRFAFDSPAAQYSEDYPWSPDGRFLPYFRRSEPVDYGAVQEGEKLIQVQIGLLDLQTGESRIIAQLPVKDTHLYRYWLMNWSADGKLAFLQDELLHLFPAPIEQGEEGMITVDVSPDPLVPGLRDVIEEEPQIYYYLPFRMNFWSDDVMIFWNNQAIWKLDLKEHLPPEK